MVPELWFVHIDQLLDSQHKEDSDFLISVAQISMIKVTAKELWVFMVGDEEPARFNRDTMRVLGFKRLEDIVKSL